MQAKILIGRTKQKALNEFCYRGSILSNHALIAKELENHTKKPACLLASWRPGFGAELPDILKERINIGGSQESLCKLCRHWGVNPRAERCMNLRVIFSSFFVFPLPKCN